MISPLDRLRLFLRPSGLALVGSKSHPEILGKSPNTSFEDTLQKIRRVDTILVGAPVDTRTIPTGRSTQGTRWFRGAAETSGIFKGALDIGDVLTVPHLVHDSMLAPDFHRDIARALYPEVLQSLLPVSPLSVLDAALSAVRELNSNARIVILGGDHAVTPAGLKAALCLAQRQAPTRVGFVQLGGSLRVKSNSLSVHTAQGWMDESLEMVPQALWSQIAVHEEPGADALPEAIVLKDTGTPADWQKALEKTVEQLHALGVNSLYFSMELGGLSESSTDGQELASKNWGAAFAKTVLALSNEFRLAGADLVAGARLGSPALQKDSQQIFVSAAAFLESLLVSR